MFFKEDVMKKFWILSVALFAMFLVASCGSESNTTDDTETPDEEAPLQCEDSEGRIYNEGDVISDKCLSAMCRDGGWAEDATTCYGCWGKELGDKMEWTCADGVTKVDWCECVEEENHGSEWKCTDRVDLNCPKE